MAAEILGSEGLIVKDATIFRLRRRRKTVFRITRNSGSLYTVSKLLASAKR